MPVKVCLVETYYGGSHRAWADGYAAVSQHDVTLVTLPAENWRWRMRGGALQVLDRVAALSASGYRPDVLLVSDMIDVGLLAALVQPHWGRPPIVMYAHENQMSYPSQRGTDPSYGLINWTSALVADEIWFNSSYHHDSFFEAVPELLSRFPDGPHTGGLEAAREKARVLPVGVRLLADGPSATEGSRRILWNHRWEHDKRPDVFVRALNELATSGLDFELSLCGEEPLGGDPLRDEFLSAMGERVVWSGHAGRSVYEDQVLGRDVVVSTADQENFGVSVVEAISGGLCPVLPNRLSYPEIVGAGFEEVLYPPGGLVEMLGRRISDPASAHEVGRRLAASMSRFGWDVVGPRYDTALQGLSDQA